MWGTGIHTTRRCHRWADDDSCRDTPATIARFHGATLNFADEVYLSNNMLTLLVAVLITGLIIYAVKHL